MERIIIIILAVLLAVSPVEAADWYVDIANDGGTENGTAWETAWGKWADISWASVQSGDTIWVRGGSYAEAMGITNKSGVSVKIDPSATTQAVFTYAHFYNTDNFELNGYIDSTYKYMFKFTSRDATYGHAINLRKSLNAALKGFECDRQGDNYTNDASQQHGVRSWDTTGNVIIDYAHIHHQSGDGINISQTDSTGMAADSYEWFLVQNSYIHDVGDDAVQGLSHTTVRNNIFDQNGHAWMLGGHPDGFQGPSGRLAGVGTAGYFKIYGNLLRGWGQNIFWEYVTDSVYAYNNVIVGGVTVTKLERGFNVSYCTVGNGSCAKDFDGTFLIANNSIYNMIDYIGINGGVPAGAIISNNTWVNCKYLSSDSTLASFIDDSNIWFDAAGVQFYDASGNPVSAPGTRYQGAAVNDDPEFNSYDKNTGFRPSSESSPLVGAGDDMSAYFTTDKAGLERGVAFDIGPYEYSEQADTTAPTASLSLPTTSSTMAVSIVSFTCEDETSLDAAPYCVTTTNSSAACAWQASAPSTITFSGDGFQTGYGWCKDASGNINSSSSSVSITSISLQRLPWRVP